MRNRGKSSSDIMKTFEAIELDSRGVFERRPPQLVCTSRDRLRLTASIEGLKKEFVIKRTLLSKDLMKPHDRELEVARR